MVCTVHLVPVGHQAATLVGSLRRYPVDRVVLVLGSHVELEGEKKAREVAKHVRKELGSIPCEDFVIDLDDVSSASLALAERIKEEGKKGCIVMVNLSGSLRSAGIAAYLAALVTGAPAYMGLPDYRDGKVVGVRDVKEVPSIPLLEVSSGKKDILAALNAAGGSMLLEDLIKSTGGDKSAVSERSRLSYHIGDLKEEGLIDSVKEGRNLKVSLTFAGRLYAASLVDR